MLKLITSFILIAEFVGISYFDSFLIQAVSENPFVTISKDISNNNFSWTDKIEVVVKIKNEGNVTARNISVIDYYPAGFKIISNDPATVTPNHIGFNRTSLKDGETSIMKYSITGIPGVQGTFQTSLIPAQLNYYDVADRKITKLSDSLPITINSKTDNWVGEIIILFLFSFFFGGLGSIIHWLNMTEADRKLLPSSKYPWRYFLLGALAGVLAVGALQGLSQYFIDANAHKAATVSVRGAE